MASLDETCLSTAGFSVVSGVFVMYLIWKSGRARFASKWMPTRLREIAKAVPLKLFMPTILRKIAKAVRLKPFIIVTIAWQITTQVSEGGVERRVGLLY